MEFSEETDFSENKNSFKTEIPPIPMPDDSDSTESGDDEVFKD